MFSHRLTWTFEFVVKELTKNHKYGKRVDAKIEEISAKIEEKLSASEAKMDERSSEAIGMTCDDKNMKEKHRGAPIENKAVATGFKEDSEEKNVKAVIEESTRVTGVKEVEYTIDCPAVPITHAFLDFQNTKTRDRYVRSANMQQTQLYGRVRKYCQVLNVEERFHRKRLGYIKCVVH